MIEENFPYSIAVQGSDFLIRIFDYLRISVVGYPVGGGG